MVLSKPAPIQSAPLQLRDLPMPEPGPGEVRVKVEACGICRTDLHVVEGELPPLTPDIVPGHQIVGRWDANGPGASRFKRGDRIGIAWLRWTCGQCRYCRAGNENLCPNARFTGYHANGGFAEYAVVPEDFAYALPTEPTAVELTPLLCAGIIGFRALRRADLRPGGRLGIYGVGSSAILALQVAQSWKCPVYVMTRSLRQQAMARDMGATWVGGAADRPPEPLDSAILFAPVGDLVPPALQALDMGGTLAVAGIYLTDIPRLHYETDLFHEKNLKSVTANTRQDGRDFLKIAAEIPIKPQTTTYPLEKANEALLALKEDHVQGAGVLVPEQ